SRTGADRGEGGTQDPTDPCRRAAILATPAGAARRAGRRDGARAASVAPARADARRGRGGRAQEVYSTDSAAADERLRKVPRRAHGDDVQASAGVPRRPESSDGDLLEPVVRRGARRPGQ